MHNGIRWYWYDGSAVQGPCSADQLRSDARVTPATQVCREGEEQWSAFGDCAELHDVPEVVPPVKSAPAPAPAPVNVLPVQSEQALPSVTPGGRARGRQYMVAAVLAVLAGAGIWWWRSDTRAERTSVAVATADTLPAVPPPAAADEVAVALEKASVAFEENFPVRAIAICEKALRRHPDETSLHLLLGKVHEHCMDKDSAAAAYRNALRYDPDNSEAREALARFAAAAPVAPDPVEANRGLAHALYSQARLNPTDTLVAELKRVQATAADDTIACFTNLGLAQIYLVRGTFPPAEQALDAAVKAGAAPELVVDLYDKGCRQRLATAATPAATALLRAAMDSEVRGKTAAAEAMFRRVLALDQNCAEAHGHLASLLQRRHSVDEAERERERALAIRTTVEGQYLRAKAVRLQRLLNVDPRNLALYRLLVDTLKALDRDPEAANACRKAALLPQPEREQERWRREADMLQGVRSTVRRRR